MTTTFAPTDLEPAGPAQQLKAGLKAIAAAAARAVGTPPRGARVLVYHSVTAEQVHGLSLDPRVSFGSHGLAHESLSGRSEAAIASEVAEARRVIEEVVGAEVPLFAYPFGVREMWDPVAREAVERTGSTAAFTS